MTMKKLTKQTKCQLPVDIDRKMRNQRQFIVYARKSEPTEKNKVRLFPINVYQKYINGLSCPERTTL